MKGGLIMDEGTKVTAKLKVQYKSGENPVSVSFQPDYQDGRNQEWATATPSLTMTVAMKPEVAAQFEVGEAIDMVLTRNPDQPGAQMFEQG